MPLNGKDNFERRSHRQKRYGAIYFIRAGDKIKIGFSMAPLDRLKTLQTSHADRLDLVGTMPGSYQTEARLHRQFRDYRRVGEWFDAKPPLLRFIELHTLEGRARTRAKPPQVPQPAPLPVDPALPTLLVTLARRYPHLPEAAQGHASNVREQIRSFIRGGEEQRKQLMPYMARSMALLEQHS